MSLPTLIHALLQPAAYPHPVDAVRLIETHISWVLLAGDYAYKIKKPLDLGFLDFSTLEKRRFCCAEEVRLNGRLAPEIYLDVVAITGSETAPRLGGTGPALEWAVRMRAFPAEATLDREPSLDAAQVDAIADRVAAFHGEIERAPAKSDFGEPRVVMHPVHENFRQIRALDPPPEAVPLLENLEQWCEAEGNRLRHHFAARKEKGYVRECHGDLHLGNIAWVNGAPLIFDCIEFNPHLRYIDVVNEAAFLFMDLVARGHPGFAWRFLNRWLEHNGDYHGLAAFRFYLVYRAMVRAKVAFIRARQGEATLLGEAMDYLGLASRLSRPGRTMLLLMHGFSGCGKTWLAQRLLETLGAIRLRSDVERKRLFDLAALASSRELAGSIYTPEASRRTFEHLLETAAGLLGEEYTVIVDATFLHRLARAPFLALAEARGYRLRILHVEATPELLRERVRQRMARGDDASEADLAVLEMQLGDFDPLTPAEQAQTLAFVAVSEFEDEFEQLRRLLSGAESAGGDPGTGV